MIRLRRKRARNGRLLFVVRARDVSGVAGLDLLVDGRRLRGSDGARLRYRWRKRPGRHTVVVKAVDAEGNRSSLEVRLRVRRGYPSHRCQRTTASRRLPAPRHFHFIPQKRFS